MSVANFGIGQSVLRAEDARLLRGEGCFTDDMAPPRATRMYVLRSPHAAARIRAIHSAAALQSPGVHAILAGEDARQDDLGGFPALVRSSAPDGSPNFEPPFPIIAQDMARYAGEPVAIIIADTIEQAKSAAELVEVNYEVMPAVITMEDAAAPGAPVIWPECPGNLNAIGKFGDPVAVDAAFANAAFTASVDMVISRVAVCAMEPRTALGEWNAAEQRYELVAGVQSPHRARNMLSTSIFKVPLHKVRVRALDVGGGFGLKGVPHPELALVLWIPGNHHAAAQGIDDPRDEVRRYLHHELGNFYDKDEVETFLAKAPEMLSFLEDNSEARFVLSGYPDYHSNAPGGTTIGRAVTAAPYDASRLGKNLARLRPPLRAITFIGMMFNSSNQDLKHFFNATHSIRSALYVARRLLSHVKDLLVHRRGVQVTSGNALVARIATTLFDKGVPLLTETRTLGLVMKDGRVTGARILHKNGKAAEIVARLGVVLACGGFPQDADRRKAFYPHVARGDGHVSPTVDTSTGDGISLAEQLGVKLEKVLANPAAWIPVSLPPLGKREHGVFPHLVDRYKPGVIAINGNGERFTNESNSYHDTGEAMIASAPGAQAWLICDHATQRRYGLGFAKPAPVPNFLYTRSGYLTKARTLAELAGKIGVPADRLEATVARFNQGAVDGVDPDFGRGTSAFNRFLGDPSVHPNPNVAPIKKGPFYAVRMVMGDLGTYDGLRTNMNGQVLDPSGASIPGLYAAGNDRRSMMGGSYPGAGTILGPVLTFAYVTAAHLAASPLRRTGVAA